MPLSDLQCRKAKAAPKLRKLSDMGGLQLWVYPTGSRLWRYAYRFGGKQKLLAIGKYPDVTLIQAREARDQARKMLVEGKDPSHAKRLARLEKEHPGDSFEVVTKEYLEKMRREARAENTMSKVEWLLSLALPTLG